MEYLTHKSNGIGPKSGNGETMNFRVPRSWLRKFRGAHIQNARKRTTVVGNILRIPESFWTQILFSTSARFLQFNWAILIKISCRKQIFEVCTNSCFYRVEDVNLRIKYAR